MEKTRIHFEDNYGTGAIECLTSSEHQEALKNLRNDPTVENIWVEYYDEEEGWQA